MKPHIGRGDDGATNLIGGPRVGKDTDRIEAAGTIDELNCTLGVVRASSSLDTRHSALDTSGAEPLASILAQVQSDLFVIGGDLAMPGDDAIRGELAPIITPPDIRRLEGWIDELAAPLPPLHHFILPDGCEQAARLHLARAVCRRAERVLVRLARVEGSKVNPLVLAYVNRLSDVLFAAARWANWKAGVPDVPWAGRQGLGARD